jgi:Fe-S cluster assembly protein SufD
MINATEQKDLYSTDFARFAETAGGRTLPARRRAAWERFRELGFPTTRHEEWRFTNVAPIARTAFVLAGPDGSAPSAADLVADTVLQSDWPRLVFINGHFAAELSTRGNLPPEVRTDSLAAALGRDAGAVREHLARYARYEEHTFTALNTAFMADGAFVHVPKGICLEHPIEMLFISSAGADPIVCHPRNLILAEPGSRAVIIERFAGLGGGVSFTNTVTEMVAGENAAIDHYKVAQEPSQAYHVGTTHVHQARDSNVASHTVTTGGALVRNDITAVLDGEGGDCTLNGLYLVSGRRHVDNHLRVEHAKPHCDSREFFKGILQDQAKAVFTGRIVVHKDAQKTDAKQTNMNLLLSEDAQVDTKPQLEIFADDVKCTHGATIGQIDEDAVFYLRCRGIDEAAARGVLVYAFAEESLQRIGPEPLRGQLREVLFDRLPQGQLLREAT